MKTVLIIVVIVLIIAILFFLLKRNKKRKKPEPDKKPDGGNNGENPPIPPTEYDDYFEKNELIVIYKNGFSPADRQKIKDAVDTNNILGTNVQKCSFGDCDSYVELWSGEGIHTIVHAEGVRAGSGLTHQNVGEDQVARYSLNFKMPLPFDKSYKCSIEDLREISSIDIPDQKRENIIIAVLDTGFFPNDNFDSRFLWTNEKPGEGGCYPNDTHGWNFVNKNGNIRDNNPNWHGTLVSYFIINEFLSSSKNFPQIMTLKTHDENGTGTLFNSICAIHYAIEKGATIINASWGFYDNEKIGHPYLDELIVKRLQKKGILFVTAAGNKIDDVDADLQNSGVAPSQLRDVKFNNFYPARLNNNNSNNIITVTTNSAETISPTQNYSNQFVDLGVLADVVRKDRMLFNIPNTSLAVSGSSYATAICTGKIGAYLPKAENIQKAQVITALNNVLIDAGPEVADKIRTKKYMKKR